MTKYRKEIPRDLGGRLRVVAQTLAGEARGEGYTGMEAVAHVILNRAAIARKWVEEYDYPHILFGNGLLASACLVGWQFSCWNPDDPNRAYIEGLTWEDRVYRDAFAIALHASNGRLTDDMTQGATHYFHRDLMDDPEKNAYAPVWVRGLNPLNVVRIGNHVFPHFN